MIEREPEPEELVRIYNGLFKDGDFEHHRAEFELIKSGRMPPNFYRRRLLKSVERICGGRTLVEIGGGTGAFGVMAANRGWQYTNYDISDVAVTFCRRLSLNANLFNAGSLPPLMPQSVDLIVMWEVVEHVWNLRGYLDHVRMALKPPGLFLFSTPNYLTPYYQNSNRWGPLAAPPIHVNFFTKESLETSLRMRGFRQNRIFKRRIYRPQWSLRGVAKSIRCALYLDEPETLYGTAQP